MKFQERFLVELKGSGLTQKQLAEKLNIDNSNITKWKRGENIPSLEIFYQLCKILDVSADYLLGLTD
jgi:transcriptional regulator with XRE-family HTH domain